MTIPIFSLKKQHELIQKQLEAAFRRVLASGTFILGPEVEAWEREFGKFLGVKHAVGVSNGSDALLLALQALDVGPGDEVILPSYTFFASAGSVSRLGARPVFVDSAPCCYNLNVGAVANAITRRTKAIMAVHLFGQAADMKPLMATASRAGIPVVEDVAQALGAKVEENFAGTIGKVGCFSFFPTKNLGALGEGGMVVTEDPGLAEKIKKLRVHGAKTKYFHEFVGGNFRLHEMQAAFLRVKLSSLPNWLEQRHRNAELYLQSLRSWKEVQLTAEHCECDESPALQKSDRGAILLPFRCQDSHTFNQFMVRLPGLNRRDLIRQALRERGIGTEIYYPRPMHVQECFSELGYQEGDFPWAETFSREILALPIYPELKDQEICRVAEELLVSAQSS